MISNKSGFIKELGKIKIKKLKHKIDVTPSAKEVEEFYKRVWTAKESLRIILPKTTNATAEH